MQEGLVFKWIFLNEVIHLSSFLWQVLDNLNFYCTLSVRFKKGERNVNRVFVVQEMPNHDISPAMKFGKIEVLLPSNTQIAFSTVPVVRKLRRKLMDYKDGDFILLTGDPVAIGLACAIASFNNGGRYTALKWDRREMLYIPVVIDVTERGESDE
jgi:hypothetical protein